MKFFIRFAALLILLALPAQAGAWTNSVPFVDSVAIDSSRVTPGRDHYSNFVVQARALRGVPIVDGFNGFKNQTNLPDIQTGGNYAFINAFKTSQGWSRGGGANAPVTPDTLDNDGYPLTTPPTTVFTVFFIPDQRDRPGNYVLAWDGNGTMSGSGSALPTATFTGSVTAGVLTAGSPSGGTIQKGMSLSGTGVAAGTKVGNQLTGSNGQAGTYAVIGTTSAGSTSMTVSGGSLTSSTGSGRYVVSGSSISTRISVGIETVGSPRITNIRWFHVDDEAALDAGEVFSSYFKNKLIEGKFGVLRGLGWGSSGGYNTTNVAKWADRKPVSYAYYGGYQIRSGDYAGSMTLSAQAYTTGNTPNGFTLADRALAHVLVGTSYPATQVSFINGSANVGWPSHGLSINSRAVLSNDINGNPGSAPPNFSLDNTLYYVVSVPDSNTVTLSTTQGGSAVVAGGNASSATVAGGGSGYTAGTQRLTVSGGTCSQQPQFDVTVSGGSITSPVLVTPGACSVTPSNPASTTGGGGSGGTLNVTYVAGSGIVKGNPQFTININNTGAKYVRNRLSLWPTESNGSRPVANGHQSLATLIYDAVFDEYLMFGGGEYSTGIDNGVPPELQMRLAVEIGAHYWFNIPFLALDPVTDYVPELMTFVKNYPGAGWMIPRYEAANEVWNFSPAFYATYYGQIKAPMLWPGTGAYYMDWYGKATSTLGQTAANIYGGGLGTAYQIIIGVQSVGAEGGGSVASNDRATAAKYVAQAAAAQSLTWRLGTINYTKSGACVSGATGCGGWASHVAPANYISPSEYGTGTEITRAANFAGVRFVASISSGTMTVTQIDTNQGNVTGTISGSVLTVTAVNSGALLVGAMINGGNMSAPRFITSFGTGSGGTGTYNLSGSESIPVSQGFSVSTVLASGKTVFGRGIVNGALQSGITITGGSQAAGWTLSSPITLASDTFYAATDMTQPALYLDSLAGSAATFNLAYVNALYIGWKAWAAGFGMSKMTFYEGGYSPDTGCGGVCPVDILRIASKWVVSSPGSATGLQGYTFGNSPSNYSNTVAAGGEFPSLFIMTSFYPVENIWSVLNDIYQPATPQWNAVKQFNFLLKRDMREPGSANDNSPMFLEKAA